MGRVEGRAYMCMYEIYIYSTDRDLICDIVSPWLYQSRAGAQRRPETDAARVPLYDLFIDGPNHTTVESISSQFVFYSL